MPRDTSRDPAVFEIIEIPRSYLESATTESPSQSQVWNAQRVQDVFGRSFNKNHKSVESKSPIALFNREVLASV